MRIVGFVGPSGTGKSHRATWVAKERGLDYIIDDGLLIKGNQLIAGTSAKRESTKIGSVKRALLVHEEHAAELRKAIDFYKPEGILILGTSEAMIGTIIKALALPPLAEVIHIEDIAEEYEIKQAISTRQEEGKHVIPVPTFEIKKDFSGYFLDPLQIFKKKGKLSYQLVGEKSVVRPTFSYLGSYTISDYTIYQIIEHVLSHIEGINRISRFRAENYPDGISIELDLILNFGYMLKELLSEVRHSVKAEVEKLTALNIKALNLTCKGIVMDQKKVDEYKRTISGHSYREKDTTE